MALFRSIMAQFEILTHLRHLYTVTLTYLEPQEAPSCTTPIQICILKYQRFYNIFLQKYLGKVAELVYIAILYYSDACHYISCCPMAKVLHMPKTKFRYRVFKKNKTYINL